MDEVIAEWVNIVFREGWMKKENQVDIVPQNVSQTYSIR